MVSEVCSQLKLNLLFDDIGVYILGTSDGETYIKGKQIGGLRNGLYYVYDTFLVEQTYSNNTKIKDFYYFTKKSNMKYPFGENAPKCFTGISNVSMEDIAWAYHTNSYCPKNKAILYHNRLGHMSKAYMQGAKRT